MRFERFTVLVLGFELCLQLLHEQLEPPNLVAQFLDFG